MPFFKDGQFYLFHQRDTRKPGPFGEPFGWALARTTDFVHFEDFGESLERGADDAQDQFIFAGSVFEAGGVYYALYTGYNRDYAKQGKASQVLMIATSDDLIHWHKTSDKLVVPQAGYDLNDWRDPFVLWDEATAEYIMILGARRLAGKKIRTGCTVYFTSKDLKSWQFKGDFWAPNLFCMHEMPDLFKMGDYWYLLTTEYSEQSKTIYRMSKSLQGPWLAPADDAFDGRAYYAARSCADGQRRYLFGWVPTKENDDDLQNWQWGGTLVVHEVYQRADGTLGVRPPADVAGAFSQQSLITSPITLRATDSCVDTYLVEHSGDHFKIDLSLTFSEGTRAFGIRLFENADTGDAYRFNAQLSEQQLTFDRTPNLPWYRYMNKGLERPLQINEGRRCNVTLIVDDTIATLYIDGVALNTRMYAKASDALAIYVVDGEVTIHNAVFGKR